MVDVKPSVVDVVPESERRWGYLVDMADVQLEETSDGQAKSWIHFLPIGEYKHPLYGKMDFSTERISRFANNIAKNVRGIDIAIDYAHKSDGEAAGWISASDESVQVRPEGLWVLVNWTQKAADSIKKKVYRYFSPEIASEWQDPKTGTVHKDVAIGGGLTNRPFLKDLLPINLSEFFATSVSPEQPKEEDVSLADKLRETFKLDEKATDDDILKAIQEANKPPVEPEKLSDPELQQLIESNPSVKALHDEVKLLKTSQKLSETMRMVEKYTTGTGKKFALPPAISDQLRDVFLDANPKLSENLSAVLDNILDNGLVPLSEEGDSRESSRRQNGSSATDEFTSRVNKYLEENPKADPSEAFREVSRDTKLFEAYRRESFSEGIMPAHEEA